MPLQIFLLQNYTMIPACIQKISVMDAYYIIEDWKYFRLYDSHLLLSIEENIPAAVKAALQSIEIKNNEVIPYGSKRIYVPCRLNWGKALLLPAEFKREFEPEQTEPE